MRGKRRKDVIGREVSNVGTIQPVPWKAKRRRARIIPDNLVQSRLNNYMSKFPNLKVRSVTI